MPNQILQALGVGTHTHHVTRTHVVHRLVTPHGEPIITVREPFSGYPVRVIQHVDAEREIEWKYTGEGHTPGDPIYEDDDRLTFAEAKRYLAKGEPKHTLIDTPEKLQALCERIVAHPHAKAILFRAKRLTELTPAPATV